MITAWTQHLTNPEEKKQFENTVQAAKPVLERLKQLIEQKESSLEFQEMSLTSYDNPNWPYRQAHQNGFKQCLTAYKKLLTLDQKETNNERPIRG